MSNSYTHKIICFSRADYCGDALVVMANTISDENEKIDLKKMPLQNSHPGSLKVNSVIVQKGGWSFGFDDPRHNYKNNSKKYYDYTRHQNDPGTYSRHFSDQAVSQRFEWMSPILDGGRYKGSNSIPSPPSAKIHNDTKPYNVKFYPKDNAFMISPAPSYCIDINESVVGGAREFRWVFLHGDVLVFDWEGDDVENPYLEFKSLDFSSRYMPIEIEWNENGKEKKWEDPNALVDRNALGFPAIKDLVRGRYHLSKDRNKVKIIHVSDHRWSFDFCCTIKGGKHYRVDPEMKIVSGST